MDWATLGPHWPGAARSHFLSVQPHRWHVQDYGPADAPVMLLLHGTGATTHSWRGVTGPLSQSWRVIAPDLPGHGFTKLGALQRSAPALMADDLVRLLARLDVTPRVIVGHSAGFALAVLLAERYMLDSLVGLAPALDDFKGTASWLFPMMARALAANPFVAPAVARLATPEGTRRIIESTGGTLDEVGLACYHACLSDTSHVDGALTMMAQWQLERVRRCLPNLDTPSLLMVGRQDKTVDPATVARAADRLPDGSVELLEGLGHLAHEQAPALICDKILRFVGMGSPVSQLRAGTS